VQEERAQGKNHRDYARNNEKFEKNDIVRETVESARIEVLKFQLIISSIANN